MKSGNRAMVIFTVLSVLIALGLDKFFDIRTIILCESAAILGITFILNSKKATSSNYVKFFQAVSIVEVVVVVIFYGLNLDSFQVTWFPVVTAFVMSAYAVLNIVNIFILFSSVGLLLKKDQSVETTD